ncbi:chemotaxis protein CheW [Phenylobacterium sp.]|uniref:chemotaxis protein CheW n=1 Tax=Phenylobacterium sp. TaxID=1871053 RepID=UPI0035B41C48
MLPILGFFVFKGGMTGEGRYILFRSAGVRWGLAAAGVVEVLPNLPVERPPGSPKALAGYANLAGEPLAVVRLARLFGAEEPQGDELYHHILRLAASAGGARLGLLVERVLDADARADGMGPLSSSQSVNEAVVGNLVIGADMVPLLDWGRLLLMEERQRIDELATAAAERLADLKAEV